MSENKSQSIGEAKTEESARSVVAYLNNHTTFTLTLRSKDLQGGEWVIQPPQTIAARTKGKWQSDSNGFMTGTEGTCVYQSNDGIIQCLIHWDNPYIGSNSYSIDVNMESLKGSYDGGGGENATVNYYLSSV